MAENIPPKAGQESVELVQELHQALRVFLVDEKAIDEVAKTKEATIIGTVILCTPIIVKVVVVFLMIRSFNSPHYGDMIAPFVAAVVALFAPFYIARGYFDGKGDIEEYYRVMTYARIPHIFTILLVVIPGFLPIALFIDFFVDLWMLWVAHVILMKTMKLSDLDSFKVVGITVIGYMILTSLLQAIF